jgi:hypothetical protein
MPNRAKLTTRGISTTTVTTETLPKNASLTNNELDSNFINLRDQTFSIVGDDSSGIDVRAGDTIKFAGAGGATITASGDTITVTAGGGGGGTGDLTIVGSTISGPSNADINLTAGGTGDINLNADTVRLGDENASVVLTSNGATSGDFTIKIGSDSTPYIKLTDAGTIEIAPDINSTTFLKSDFTTLGSGSSSGTLNTNGATDLILRTNTSGTSSTIELKPGANGDINIWPNGIGKIQLDNHYWPNVDGSTGQVLSTNGSGQLSWVSSGGTGDLTIVGSEISGPSNGDISITPGGTGNVVLKTETLRIGDPDVATEGDVINIFTATDQSLYIATSNLDASGASVKLIEESGNERIELTVPSGSSGGVYLNASKIRLGFSAVESTITTNSVGNLVLNTNSGTNSGAITVAAGFNGNISIIPNGTGKIQLDNNYWPNTDGTVGQVLTTDGAGILSWTTATAQGITFVGDDSTGTRISDNETIKIAGAGGISTSMSGDTLTISGSQGITIVGDDSTGTRVSDNETFKIAGAGSVSTAVSGDTLTITGTNTTYSISAETATGGANLRLTDSGAGTDDVKFASGTGITVSQTDANTITVATSATYLTDIVNDATPQLGGSLDVNGQTITSTSNGNIELAPNGTGDVYLTADTIRVGDSNANATLTTNGTGDLTLNTNSGTSSNSIVIEDTATGRIQLIPNSTGRIDLGPVADGSATGLVNFPSAITTNSLGPGDARIKGTGRFYSNLAYTPYTAATSQETTSNDYTMLKTDGGSFDSANIRNTAAAHSMIFDLNGGSATSTTTNVTATGVRAASNQVWYMNNAGGTKTGLNINVNGNAANIVAGHAGDLTIPRVVGYVNDVNFARNTGDTTRVTEMWAFRDQGIAYSGTGTTGTNSILTDYTAYETGLNAPSSTNTPWAFRVRSTSQNWRSSIGASDLPKRWSTSTTHSSGSAYTVDYQSSGNGFRQVTLTSNITSFTMSNFPTSTVIISEFDIVFIQDGTGGRTIAFTPTSTEVFKFRNGTNSLSDSTAAPEVLHAKVFVRYDGTKSIYYWDIDNREYV